MYTNIMGKWEGIAESRRKFKNRKMIKLQLLFNHLTTSRHFTIKDIVFYF
jgi:hypothetical protein